MRCAQGAVFAGHNENGSQRWSTKCTVTDAEPGRVFAFDVRHSVIPIARWQYDIVAADGGCQVTESTWDRRPGWFRKLAGKATGVPDRRPPTPSTSGSPCSASSNAPRPGSEEDGTSMTRRDPAVAVVGAGMSGLCVAIALLRSGITDVTIYEKADEVGGTWRENTYPGLTCDVPSRVYQYTFATQPELDAPVLARRRDPGLLPWHRRPIRAAGPDSVRHRNRQRPIRRRPLGAAHGDGSQAGEESKVDFLISATGVLHHPRMPSIAGLDDFGGHAFHSARWDHSVELPGRRIAVIGNGSTGVQLVCGLAGVAGKLLMFQRTAQWIAPAAQSRATRRFTSITRQTFPWLDRWPTGHTALHTTPSRSH